MKSFKTSLITVLLVGTMATVLAGCGETAKPTQPAAAPAPAQTSPAQNTTPAPTPTPAATTVAKASGKDIFTTNCVSCHGANGIGATGPALNKAVLSIGVKTSVNTLAFIKEGKLDKGMPAWQNVLSDDDIKAVSDYVVSLK